MENTSPQKSTWNPIKLWKNEFSKLQKGCGCLYLLCIVVWPVLAMLTLFLYDNTALTPWQEKVRTMAAWLIFGFPFYFIPLLIVAHKVGKRLGCFFYYLLLTLPTLSLITVALCLLDSIQYTPEGVDTEVVYGYTQADGEVMYDGQPVSVADYDSFRAIGHNYARDRQQVYYKDTIVVGADPRSFRVIDAALHIGQDKNRVYYENRATAVRDFGMLEPTDDGYTDGTHCYDHQLDRLP